MDTNDRKNKHGPGELQYKAFDVFQLEACEENLTVFWGLFSDLFVDGETIKIMLA